MLSYPYSFPQHHQQQQQDYSSSPPQSGPAGQVASSTGLLTSSFDPGFLDDLAFLDARDPLSSSLPLNDHGGWFPFSAEPFDGLTGMNFDDPSFCHSSVMPTINELNVSSSTSVSELHPYFAYLLTLPSLQMPLPLLSQSFSPEPTFLSPEYQQSQPQPPQQPSHKPTTSQSRLQAPSYRGHRRRRSSSVPSLFHSVKKRMVQTSIVPPGGTINSNLDQERPYSAQPTTMIAGSVPPVPTHQHQPLYYVPPAQNTKPLAIQIQRNPASHRRPSSTIELNQDQLDEKLLQVNFNDVTVAELKDYLRERNLSVAGRKAELTQRLYNERQQVHARRQGNKPSVQDTPIITSPIAPSPTPTTTSLSASPPSSVFSSSSLADASSPRPIQQLTHRLHHMDIQPSSPYHQQTPHPSLMAPFKLSLPTSPVVQQTNWEDDGTMPLFYQF
ncbi:hypothetical protein [Absidia glauca]|uniref:SAP domain-containing protein n=1 Tax=Absidia glauca TaxID=4829 RepID=A0A168Q7A8_ABSGL|nr:hypothetical protein [Absidia glauca]